MTHDKFSVSIKGILCKEGRVLLRKNQRKEYELIGGKLDINDASPQERLSIEFLEEAGASIDVLAMRFPWLYLIGKKNIIIIPYICELLSIDESHVDEDGGRINWFSKNDIDSLFLPIGYIDSIYGRTPKTSFSLVEGEFLKIIPNYKETDYYVRIIVTSINGDILANEYLQHYCSPLDLITKTISGFDIDALYPLKIEKETDIISIYYVYYR